MNRASAGLLDSVPPAELQALCRRYADRLGPMTRYDGIKSRSLNVNNNVTTGEFEAAIQCEKAPATVTVKIVKQDDTWKIFSFNVTSSALVAR